MHSMPQQPPCAAADFHALPFHRVPTAATAARSGGSGSTTTVGISSIHSSGLPLRHSSGN